MSGPFSSYTEGHTSPRTWGRPLGGSVLLYLVVAVAFAAVGSRVARSPKEREVQLTFVEEVVRPAPPPAPPVPVANPEPPKAIQPQVAPAGAPVVPPNLKVRKLDRPPPRKELTAPKEMPADIPKEADPAEDPGVAVFGEPGLGDAAGLEGGSEKGTVGGTVGVIDLPAGAIEPTPLRSNRPLRYPPKAKRSGKIGIVEIRCEVLADGSIRNVKAVKGEEPFVSAAIETVSTWRFKPATLDGVPIAVRHPFRVRFTLDD